jgi:hypothetical protein
MWTTIRDSATAFHRSFHSSLVIWWARFQVLFGAVWAVLIATDISPLLGNPKYFTAWLVFSGVMTEMGRRSRTVEDEDGKLIPRRRDDDDTINVVVNNSAPPSVAVPASPVPTDGTAK